MWGFIRKYCVTFFGKGPLCRCGHPRHLHFNDKKDPHSKHDQLFVGKSTACFAIARNGRYDCACNKFRTAKPVDTTRDQVAARLRRKGWRYDEGDWVSPITKIPYSLENAAQIENLRIRGKLRW